MARHSAISCGSITRTTHPTGDGRIRPGRSLGDTGDAGTCIRDMRRVILYTSIKQYMSMIIRPFVEALKDILKAHREPTRYEVWNV